MNPDTVQQNAAEVATQEAAVALAWADLGLSEDITVPEDQQAEFLALLNDPLTDKKAWAGKALAVHQKLLEGSAKQLEDHWNQTQATWRDEVSAMPEFAGAKMQPALAEIAKLVDRYGGKELRQAMNLTGAGNHPQVVRFLHRIAKDINERAPVSGAAPGEARASRETRMYGNQGT